jgi:hypothetical protein
MELIMLFLLLVSGSVICVLGYHSVAAMLRQIPSRNEDFNAFFSENELERVSSIAADATPDARHLKREVSVGNAASAIVRTGNS